MLVFCFVLGEVGRVEAQSKPNIILINLDDADAELFELPYSDALFPNIMALANEGISFSNFHATTPLCGPSRACLYRAQYAHNTQVQINIPRAANANGFNGGFKFYREQGYFEDDLSTWMKDAGYRTMLVGKFLHADFEKYVPPGWDDFRSYLGGLYYGVRKFTNEEFEAGRVVLLAADRYRTIAEMEDSLELMQQHADANVDQPFFLNINPLGPHRAQQSNPTMIDQNRTHWWPNISQPFSRAYNEADTSDKGGLYRLLKPVDEFLQLQHAVHYRERALATRSVDDLVGAVRQKVQELGIEENTYIIVTSDNGFAIGHNRAFGKGLPSDRASRVPCFIVGPNVPSGQISNHLIAHIDIGPTITQLAGGEVPSFVDGRSFARLLKPGGLTSVPNFRVGMLIENFSRINVYPLIGGNAASTTVRFKSEIYTEWSNGDREYYDLRIDPDQLTNRYDVLPLSKRQLFAAWLRVLYNSDRPTSATFAVPHEIGQEINVQGAISGIAEDWDGVDSVRLAIRDTVTKDYWNGDNWQAEFAQVSAELASRGGQLTEWKYDNMPARSDETSGRFVAWAWAFAPGRGFARPKVGQFRYDTTRPEVSFLDETEREFEGAVHLLGRATDSVGAEKVTLVFRSLDTGLYWAPGVGFVEDPVEIEPELTSDGRWVYHWNMPVGRFTAIAVALDGSGNESRPEFFDFEIVD